MPAKKKETQLPNDIFTEPFEAVLRGLGITTYDFVIVGDGSGNTWEHECGWASIALRYNSLERKVFFGAMNYGSNNTGEMMAYLQPLMWFAAKEQKRRKAPGAAPRIYSVHILTDSDYCRGRGTGSGRDFKTNLPFWNLFDMISRQGFQLHWHWIRRDSFGLNVYADQLSRAARLLVRESQLQKATEIAGKYPVQVDECNPFE